MDKFQNLSVLAVAVETDAAANGALANSGNSGSSSNGGGGGGCHFNRP